MGFGPALGASFFFPKPERHVGDKLVTISNHILRKCHIGTYRIKIKQVGSNDIKWCSAQ
jgi:mRNA-degrading endonuclease RelE of RelBE toxin-antitoxin system